MQMYASLCANVYRSLLRLELPQKRQIATTLVPFTTLCSRELISSESATKCESKLDAFPVVNSVCDIFL